LKTDTLKIDGFLFYIENKTFPMKNLTAAMFIFLPLLICAQQTDYAVTSYKDEGTKAPNTHYIGEAWLNGLLRAEGDLTYNVTKATFRANSTLDWHTHETPQVLIWTGIPMKPRRCSLSWKERGTTRKGERSPSG
jgi:hypothetical protein